MALSRNRDTNKNWPWASCWLYLKFQPTPVLLPCVSRSVVPIAALGEERRAGPEERGRGGGHGHHRDRGDAERQRPGQVASPPAGVLGGSSCEITALFVASLNRHAGSKKEKRLFLGAARFAGGMSSMECLSNYFRGGSP